MSPLEMGSGFLMGLMGSVHCVTMCGPIAAVLCSGERSTALWPHLGKLLAYAALGTLAGAGGALIQRLVPLAFVQLGARILASTLLIAVGFYAAGFFRGFALLERLTSPLFRRLAGRAATRARNSAWSLLLQGAVWGLLPCGLVYGALGLAALTGSPAGGAQVMLSFGAGTLPALIVVSMFAERFTRLVRQARIRQSAGLLLALGGTVHLVLAVQGIRTFDLATVRPESDPSVAGPSCCDRGNK